MRIFSFLEQTETGPGAVPRLLLRFPKLKSEQEENMMEITIKINGRMVSVEVNDEVAPQKNII